MSACKIYYGTAHAGDDSGIYCQTFESDSGNLGDLRRVAAGPAAGFQAVGKGGSILYSVAQAESGEGLARSYRIAAESGDLELISEQMTGGGKPCFVGRDHGEAFLLITSYSDAVVTVFPLDGEGGIRPKTCVLQHEGGSGVNAARQEAAHTHSVYMDSSDRYVFVCDLGEDQIVIYELDRDQGILVAAEQGALDTAPGAGPRHMAFHPNGRWAYVINELDGTIGKLDWDAESGRLSLGPTVSTLPSDFSGENTTAEIVVSPDGRFVYGSNRGHDSMVVYSIDDDTGDLSLTQIESTRGGHPRNFNLSPDGKWLVVANRDSDNAVFFRIDKASGRIEYADKEVSVPKPICVKFV